MSVKLQGATEPGFIKTVSSELKLLIDGIQTEIQKVAFRAIKPQALQRAIVLPDA